MARLSKRHRLAIARGVRRYWRRVKTTARQDNTSIKDARARLKLVRQEKTRAKRRIDIPPVRGWQSPDPEGEVAFNLQDRDAQEPPPWSPRLGLRFGRQVTVRVTGYWEYRASPTVPAVADDFTFEFDPGGTEEEFWSYYFEGLRALHDEITTSEKYERLGIYVTRMV